ncbi:DNA repair protein RecO [Ectothiorhodospira haloalkaliphila]|uniref:DNA repair protein RecO n=1 Tax=Ectothiorhodospira haloalkaliphila TaxID=421628 RepID=W8L452_9GAMM|nr:DNA repair protein RecO [Ectothiorhodospira haloalkaliphila]MCG5493924.1 DNA repair protein RecO [Ectothiorhodospira variabilis]AHK78675.1 DNA repair protein RecO [Ectothiorhodospira haloalkaliphila]MCG5498138.1 DNA repair protein RecO [Ectothiorhodospira variabilis]MCG5503727.1 DNA repair protein RecO [Ectothiorhodospira variabilis]MCG5506883.1 DNA repair protein RecO [Ectothiorhodospira variabilis]
MSTVSRSIGYVLHARPYRETSQLLELFTVSEGRMAAVLRGARNRGRHAAQPFRRMELAWSGRGQVQTLTQCDEIGAMRLKGDRAICGLYVNELAMKLLPRQIQAPDLFEAYEQVLCQLADAGIPVERPLRQYELALLKWLGEGLEFLSSDDLEPGAHYVLEPQQTPRRAGAGEMDSPHCITGRALTALLCGQLEDREDRRQARRVLRLLLDHHLDGKPLVSRQLIARGRSDATS